MCSADRYVPIFLFQTQPGRQKAAVNDPPSSTGHQQQTVRALKSGLKTLKFADDVIKKQELE